MILCILYFFTSFELRSFTFILRFLFGSHCCLSIYLFFTIFLQCKWDITRSLTVTDRAASHSIDHENFPSTQHVNNLLRITRCTVLWHKKALGPMQVFHPLTGKTTKKNGMEIWVLHAHSWGSSVVESWLLDELWLNWKVSVLVKLKTACCRLNCRGHALLDLGGWGGQAGGLSFSSTNTVWDLPTEA